MRHFILVRRSRIGWRLGGFRADFIRKYHEREREGERSGNHIPAGYSDRGSEGNYLLSMRNYDSKRKINPQNSELQI